MSMITIKLHGGPLDGDSGNVERKSLATMDFHGMLALFVRSKTGKPLVYRSDGPADLDIVTEIDLHFAGYAVDFPRGIP
jgi:hypothetical protein